MNGELTSPARGTELPRRPTGARGWALVRGELVTRIEILVDGREAGRARLGLPGDDRAGSGHPGAPVCGFDFVIAEDVMPARGRAMTIEAVVHTRQGTRGHLEEVTVRIGDPEPAVGDADGHAAELRRRGAARRSRGPGWTGSRSACSPPSPVVSTAVRRAASRRAAS